MKVCAIMSSYNEEDIIEESLLRLITSGIEVFLIDNNSTDQTRQKVEKYKGRGLVGVRVVTFLENDREVYSWIGILKLKEEISRQLNYDWYIHVDADEIRYGPWPKMNLLEAIRKVDDQGYNLINFKLYDFRCTSLPGATRAFEETMNFCSPSDPFNQKQVKAWKRHDSINLHDSGGHVAKVPDARVYPVRFILKHYPLRSLEQARKKILIDRKRRFVDAERRVGWHVQYDAYESEEDIAKKLVWVQDALNRFSLTDVQLALLAEGLDKVVDVGEDRQFVGMPDAELFEAFLNAERRRLIENPDAEHVLKPVTDMLVACLTGNWKRVQSELLRCTDKSAMSVYVRLSRIMYLRGDPLLSELLKTAH